MNPNLIPTRIDKHSPTEMLLTWSDGASYAVPFVDLRFFCPCAGCVDEHTGERTILRSSIAPEVRPVGVQLVGRYGVQISWDDGHATGMFHFDRLRELCTKLGRKLT
ncbi:MAG: DUF971 domain-containing protein [Oligoflexia bacterium]|nr:DUF971 domain-containing protein [Oligoflexia bacterium]